MTAERKVIDMMKSCGIDVVLTLPCDRMKNLLSMIPMNFEEIPLTREEGGCGIAAGLYMAGKRPALLIQSTGIGNSLNAISSLHMTYRIPLPILASWRGVYKETIPAQVHWGKSLPAVLDNMGIPYLVVEKTDDLNGAREMIEGSYDNGLVCVILLSPKLWEESGAQVRPEPERTPLEGHYSIGCETTIPKAIHTRYDMIKGAASYFMDKIVVSNIGIPSKELYAAANQDTNFYMLGSMGLATPIGIGLALGQKRREVIVLDGDGSLLMNPNGLGMAAQESPDNLTIIAFDNCAHGSTGNQPTYSCSMDLELLARVYGIRNTTKASTVNELLDALKSGGKGPRFIHVPVLAKNADVPNIGMSPVEIRKRFMSAIA